MIVYGFLDELSKRASIYDDFEKARYAWADIEPEYRTLKQGVTFNPGGNKALMAAAIAAGVGGLAGLGALSGHMTHVDNKLEYAKHGKKYVPETFIQKHPKLMGALSLGLAPAVSSNYTKRALNLSNPKVREVLKEHPHVARLLLGETV